MIIIVSKSYLVANLYQNLIHPGRTHGYYELEALCSAYPGRWAEYSVVRERWILSVQSMLALRQPSLLDLQHHAYIKVNNTAQNKS